MKLRRRAAIVFYGCGAALCALRLGSPLDQVLPLVALRLGGAAALLRTALLCFQAMECFDWRAGTTRPSVLRALRGCQIGARFVF